MITTSRTLCLTVVSRVEVEGFEAMLETTDRKERKDLIDNEPLKKLRGSREKRNGSIRPGDRVGLNCQASGGES